MVVLDSMLQDKNMRTLLVINILYSFSGMCIFANTPAVLTDIGFSTVFATGIATSCNSLANCIGKFGMGRVSDKLGCKKMLLLWYGITPLAILYFMMARTVAVPGGIIGALLAGYIGGIYSIPISITAGLLYEDHTSYTTVVSYCTAAATLCNTCSNIIFHGFYDVSGSYLISLTYAFVLSVVCFVLVKGLILRNRKVFLQVAKTDYVIGEHKKR